MSEQLQNLKRLLARQRAVRMQIEVQYSRAEKLNTRFRDSFAIVDANMDKHASATEDMTSRLSGELKDRLSELDDLATQLMQQVMARKNELADLDVKGVATMLRDASSDLLEEVETEFTPKLANLIEEKLDEGWRALQEESDALIGEWEATTGAIEEIKTETETALDAMKNDLESAFEQFTDIDIDEVLEDAGQRLFEAFGGAVTNIVERIQRLREDIIALIDRLQNIQQVFLQARRAKDVAQSSAGTGLLAVAGIFDALKETFEAV